MIALIKKFCITKNISFLKELDISIQEKFVEESKKIFEKDINNEMVNIVLSHFCASDNRRDIIIKNFNNLIIWQRQEKESGYVFKIKNYQKLISCFENKYVPNWETARNIIFSCFSNPKTLLEKLREIWKNGSLECFNNEENEALSNITKIQWIGPVKAKKLYDIGCTTIKDVKDMYVNEKISLTYAQRISLLYIDDTHEISYETHVSHASNGCANYTEKEIVKPRRIPREEIDILNEVFENYVKQKEHVNIKIVGSYRRKLPSSGDIDVLITTSDNDLYAVHKLVKYIPFKVVKIVEGISKFLGYIKIDKYYRRIDILLTSQKEYPFSVLYFTGSKEFNVRMRSHALKMGYSMNEHGLTPDPGVDIKTELDIFKFLQYPYVKPSQRM